MLQRPIGLRRSCLISRNGPNLAEHRSEPIVTAQSAAWLTTLGVAAVLIVLPLGRLYFRAFMQPGALDLILSTTEFSILGRTLALASAVAFFGTALGTAAGLCLGAREWSGRSLFRLLILLPLVVPPYIHAVGWSNLLRADGLISRLCQTIGASPSFTSQLIYSFGGAAFVLTLAYFPIAALLAEKALALSPYSLVEAATVFGGNTRQAFLYARWPYLRSAALTSGIILFLLTAAELGVPTILKVSVFNFEVFTQLSAFNDFAGATILATPLILAGIGLVFLERRLLPNEEIRADVAETGSQPAATKRYVFASVAFLLVSLVTAFGIPIGHVLSAAFGRNALHEMGRVAIDPGRVTIIYSASAAVLAVSIAGAFTLTLENGPPWRYRLSDSVLVIGFAVPGVILALGFLSTFQISTSLALPATVMVVLALVARYLIIPHRTLIASYAQLPNEFIDAAKVDGANRRQVLCFVVLPLLRIPLITAFLIVFVLSVGEIGSTIMLYPPGGETLPIALYSIEANSPRSYVAAMALYEVVICLVPLFGLLVAYGAFRGATVLRARIS